MTLAEHLTRKEILSRDRRYEVSGAALDRWSEPLESNITSVLAENLSDLITPDTKIHSVQTPGSNGSLLEENQDLRRIGPKSNTEPM
ncbi:MAG: hypothetical protein E2O38_01100 [Proteobacteria bacterium]|nr:MAG: hypothetical protein E2O38_01100 [Pseudomonadota bacterium]